MSSRTTTHEDFAQDAAQTFVYRPVSSADGANGNGGQPGISLEETATANNEVQRREQEAWQKGFAEGQAKHRTESEKAVAELRDTVSKTLRDFSRERESYFGRAEEEVVRLALVIARKILNREAQIDPLLLTGLVHVALEKLSEGTQARLRTHTSQFTSWREYFRQPPEGKIVPELIGDNSLSPTQCILETELGSTEISLEGHLKEIEQGFFDLLAHRPRPD